MQAGPAALPARSALASVLLAQPLHPCQERKQVQGQAQQAQVTGRLEQMLERPAQQGRR